MKVTLWTVVPNHYQGPFLAALRDAGIDLRVNYYGRVRPERLRMGWDAFETLPPGERYVKPELSQETLGDDWRGRIHVVPGYGQRFLRSLAIFFSKAGAQWAHWSEPAHPGWQWYAAYPLRRWYARLVNRYALGAFAIGEAACRDFARWGVRAEKTAILTYSNPAIPSNTQPDSLCERFRGRRNAFLFVGSIEPRKGVDVLLRAFACIAGTAEGWALILAGDDRSAGKYQRGIAAQGLGRHVLFRGPVAASAIGSVLRSAQVLVLPSRFDGWGVVLNEAAVAGLALIASDRCGAAYHLIHPGRNGFRVRAGSVESLAAAMAAYAANPELAVKHGAESARISAEYSPEQNAKRFLAGLEAWQALKSVSNARRD